MHGVQVRGPEVPLELPGLQVLGGVPHSAAGLLGLGARLPGAQEHPVLLALLIPQQEGVPPVIGVVAGLGHQVQVLIGLGPVEQVIAGGVHLHLAGLALLGEQHVVAGVESVVLAQGLDNASRKDILVLLLIRAVGDGRAQVLVVDEVPGEHQLPVQGVPVLRGLAGVFQIIKVEDAVLSKGHAVSKGAARTIVVQLCHCNVPPKINSCSGSG